MAALFDANDVASPGHYKAAETALLLLDFHTMLLDRIPASAAVGVAARLRQWAKETGITVVHGLIDPDAPCLAIAKGHKRMETIGATMTSSGGGKEAAELLVGGHDEQELHFKRPLGYVSALSSPRILEELRSRGIRSLVLCGLSTSGCVLRTAVDACEKAFVTTVISDACADSDEETHRVVTQKILLMTAFVSSGADFISGFNASE